MGKINLYKIDIERWVYILYKDENNNYYLDVPYSPISFVDVSMLIKLNEEETNLILNDKKRLYDFARNISYYFNDYLNRALKIDNYIFE